jgi:hypothetical protein
LQLRSSGLENIRLDATTQLAAEAEGHAGAKNWQGARDLSLLEAVLKGIY